MECRAGRESCFVVAASFLIAAHAGTAADGTPAGVDVLPLRAVLHDDVRVLWLGDSYAIPYAERASAGSLLSWRVDHWTAFTLGDGPSWFNVVFEPIDPSVRTIDAANSYTLYESGPDAETKYGLPLWRLREYRHPDHVTARSDLIRYRARRNPPIVGFHGSFAVSGDTVRVRQILLDPPGAPVSVESLELTSGSASIEFDPREQSRPKRIDGLDPDIDGPVPPADGQIFAAPEDMPVVINAASELDYILSVGESTGLGGYVFPAGLTAYRTTNGDREPGLHFSALADGSWSYEGFGLDTPSGTPGFPVKTFSRAQLAHWLDATTIERTQPIYAFYLVNVEDIEPNEATDVMTRMIDQTAAAAADANLGPVRHCIVIPWNHRISGQVIPGRHQEQRDAAFAIAGTREDVSAVSIFDFTDGQWFDGNTVSRAWLADHGYDAFAYGDILVDLAADGGGANGGLLDVFRSHPQGRDAGAFFAHVIERVIFDACPADFRAPWGVLDLADISGFLTGFLQQRPSSDLVAPVGVWDLDDLSAFVTSFTNGCAE